MRPLFGLKNRLFRVSLANLSFPLLQRILIATLAVSAVISFDFIGLHIPLLRQVISFVYLTFLPGMVILRILRIHNLTNIEVFLYSIGLSLTFLMLIGLFMNIVYPMVGVSKPFETMPLTITIIATILVLCIINYLNDRKIHKPKVPINIDIYIDMFTLSASEITILLLPFICIFGTYLVNFYHSNIILMILIVIISLLPTLKTCSHILSERSTPLIITIISLCLLYFQSLITMYIVGWDVHGEYHIAKLVENSAHWNPTIPNNANAMLSTVILPVVYSKLLNMELTWVFKIVFPFLFSLVPLGLYEVFRRQTNEKIAFLSVFFFMSIPASYFTIVSLPRQIIAMIFVTLLLLLVTDKKMDEGRKKLLSVIFGASLIMSHYGTSYVFMIILITVFLIGAVIHSDIGHKSTSLTFILFFTVYALTWYMYTSSSSNLNTIVLFGEHIWKFIFTELLNPQTRDFFWIIAGYRQSLTYRIAVILHLVTQFFIMVGFLELLLRYKQKKSFDEISIFSLAAFGIIVMCFIIPFFSRGLNIDRIYLIVLMILAPLCPIGFKCFLMAFNKFWRTTKWREEAQVIQISFRLFSVFLVIFLLFNCGFINELVKDHPRSSPLSTESVKVYGDIDDKASFYVKYTMEQDVFSAKWLSRSRAEHIKIYADLISCDHVLGSYGMIPFYILPEQQSYYPLPLNVPKEESYIYLRYFNVVEHSQYRSEPGPITSEPIKIENFSNGSNKIYTNGWSEIYYCDGQ